MRFLFTKDSDGESEGSQREIFTQRGESLGESALHDFSSRLTGESESSTPSVMAGRMLSGRPARVRVVGQEMPAQQPMRAEEEEDRPQGKRSQPGKNCLHCGCALTLVARCLDRRFCSPEHGRLYNNQVQQRLLARLTEADSTRRPGQGPRVPIQSISMRHTGSRHAVPVVPHVERPGASWPDWLLVDAGTFSVWRWTRAPQGVSFERSTPPHLSCGSLDVAPGPHECAPNYWQPNAYWHAVGPDAPQARTGSWSPASGYEMRQCVMALAAQRGVAAALADFSAFGTASFKDAGQSVEQLPGFALFEPPASHLARLTAYWPYRLNLAVLPGAVQQVWHPTWTTVERSGDAGKPARAWAQETTPLRASVPLLLATRAVEGPLPYPGCAAGWTLSPRRDAGPRAVEPGEAVASDSVDTIVVRTSAVFALATPVVELAPDWLWPLTNWVSSSRWASSPKAGILAIPFSAGEESRDRCRVAPAHPWPRVSSSPYLAGHGRLRVG